MNKNPIFLLVIFLALLQPAMGRNAQYDEEARQQEKIEKEARKAQKQGEGLASEGPLKRIATGVKQATVDSTVGLVEDTVEETKEEPPVVGTLEGARKGTEKLLDNTVKGVGKIATLGYGDVDHYEVEPPPADADPNSKIKDDTAKIKIKIPGT